MSEANVRIRVKVGVNEAEIEAPLSSLRQTIELLPEIIQRIPRPTARAETPQTTGPPSPSETEKPTTESLRSKIPEIKIERDDSLTNVITKLFSDSWGKRPQKLADVREILESYGMVYSKQSVAVALLRLAQAGKLRRFKDEGGEFIYTASTGLSAEPSDLSQPAEELALQPANQ